MKALDWVRARPGWQKVAAVGVGCGLVGFGAGRFAAPTKVLETERVVEVVKVDEKAVARAVSEARSNWEREVRDNTRIVTKYVEGKPVERIEYRDRETQAHGGKVEVQTVEVVREVKVEVVKEVEVTKLVERDCPRVTLTATVGAGFAGGTFTPPVYGMEALGRVWGPLVVGAGAEGNALGGSARVLVGATF